MSEFQQIKISDVGDVAVVRFNNNKIIDEMQIQLFGEELYALAKEVERKLRPPQM